jgi:alkanesulfonate monooxygenase SsuD/methylene tetrahydromethanopterin reductase-like flavin-dependent oxidoreductase (luciferase family)
VKIGLGLPNPVPDCPGTLLPEWAVAAERSGFSSVATIDRIAFPSHETMTSLAAAAAVTERIGLLSNVIILPTRDTAVVAKEAATVGAISGGRFTLGVGVGAREDDFATTNQGFADRGRRTDVMLETMIRAWRGEPVAGSPKPIVPEVPGGTVPMLIGGYTDQSRRRVVRYGQGWTAGGIPADRVGVIAAQVRKAWRDADREGEPRIVALTYFSLGDDVEERSYGYLRHYYGHNKDGGQAVAARAPRSPAAIREAMNRYADAGVDELIFDPTVAELSQVERLADVVL